MLNDIHLLKEKLNKNNNNQQTNNSDDSGLINDHNNLIKIHKIHYFIKANQKLFSDPKTQQFQIKKTYDLYLKFTNIENMD